MIYTRVHQRVDESRGWIRWKHQKSQFPAFHARPEKNFPRKSRNVWGEDLFSFDGFPSAIRACTCVLHNKQQAQRRAVSISRPKRTKMCVADQASQMSGTNKPFAMCSCCSSSCLWNRKQCVKGVLYETSETMKCAFAFIDVVCGFEAIEFQRQRRNSFFGKCQSMLQSASGFFSRSCRAIKQRKWRRAAKPRQSLQRCARVINRKQKKKKVLLFPLSKVFLLIKHWLSVLLLFTHVIRLKWNFISYV